MLTCISAKSYVLQQSHERFTWIGDDLYHKVKISLSEALCGWTRQIELLSGEIAEICNKGVTDPDTDFVVQGFGMPKMRKSGERGDLRISADISFPGKLSAEQKALVQMALSMSEDNSDD